MSAQTGGAKPAKAIPQVQAGMTNQDVLKLAKAGFSDDLILSAIAGAEKSYFTLTPDALVALKKAGVSEPVIAAMLRAAAGAPQAMPAPPVPAAIQSPPTAPADPRPAADIAPPEIGVYRRDAGSLVEIRPEIVNWRTGGILRRMATAGLSGGHVNGWITGPRSPNALSLPAEIVIYTPEGTSITEYQLLRCDQKETRREFRVMSASIAGARSGADAHAIEFASDKVAPRIYVVRLENLPLGEYGFLPPGLAASSMAASGKIYSFSIK